MNQLNHIAFIMDGNSSWAALNNRPKMEGYLKGMQNMSKTILNVKDFGIKYATFYAFSTENWNRPKSWISEFMSLALNFLRNDPSIKDLLNANAKLKIIGDKTKLSQEIQDILNEYEEKTKDNTDIVVQLAISYGARDEIVRTINKISKLGLEASEENISNNLDTAGIPDPDMIVRTSGKQRLSNFLLWQAAYSEFYFSQLFWPEFDKTELQKVINEFANRKRTYGK